MHTVRGQSPVHIIPVYKHTKKSSRVSDRADGKNARITLSLKYEYLRAGDEGTQRVPYKADYRSLGYDWGASTTESQMNILYARLHNTAQQNQSILDSSQDYPVIPMEKQ